MQAMFAGANAFNQSLSDWDVSNVLHMNYMFEGSNGFNGDVSGWDVSSVTGMHKMFYAASSFNQDISAWNVSNVTDMAHMFQNAHEFNGDISGWDVSSVSNMSHMFYANSSFNGDLSDWDVSSVTDMSNMFDGAHSFNNNLSSWDVSSVINMSGMFWSAHNFNGDISGWDVSNVTNMFKMFIGASSFNQDLSSWDVSAVTNMDEIFNGANALSEENKCAIHMSFSSNPNWPYDWVEFCVPTIASIIDVPEDQGGRVYVSFNASFFDVSEVSNQSYGIMRYDYFENDSSGWVALMSFPAIGEGSYTYEVATLRDSTADDDGMTEYKVVAAMNEGNFHSAPAMGYSTDDIAPGVPQGLMAVLVDEGIHLTWEMSADEDFQYYMLEKSSDEAFTEPEVFEMIDIAYLDLNYALNENNYYRIAAVDHAGNMSDYSDVVDFTVLDTDLDFIPKVFALHQNYPNPFNPTTQIKYDLSEDAMVSITIYDLMGRSIRSLVNTTQSVGYRSIQWDATDNLGEPVSAGMYIYMIQAGEFRQTKKMVLLK
jgi:surface protein